jgi:CubicO group peptidase (beta-lactamase class C family)
MTTPVARYQRAVQKVQAEARIPAVSVAMHRADRRLWTFTVGDSGNRDHPLDRDSRFRIGSVTKTFTAVLVMQARDEGLLDLDDPIAKHLEVPAHGDATVRRLLSHTAGFQREPHGDVWDTLISPDAETMLADLERVERVLPNNRRFHYSNLGMAVLGELVARLRGGTWSDLIRERITEPLGLHATTAASTPQSVVGYLVDSYSDAARPEPQLDMGGASAAAQLWSTAGDLARWAAFLASPEIIDPRGKVLAAATLDEMRWPLTTTDEQLWAAGFGLGLILEPQSPTAHGKRVVHIGHDGAMPGFLAGAYGRRGGDGNPGALGCAVLGSSGTALEINELVHELLRLAVELARPRSSPGRRPRPRPTSTARPWASGGARACRSCSLGTTARCRRAARTRPRTGRLRCSGRCPTSRTCCARSPGGRWGKGSG